MIPRAAITAWAHGVPWPTVDQVEQDLLLSRLIVEIANHPYLGDELVFRGGTCLHKLHLRTALRYSEDLDYVRVNATGIGDALNALRDIGTRLGMQVNTAVGDKPKVYLKSRFEDAPHLPIRLKVEMNTHERSPAQPLIRLPFTVRSAWFTGGAHVRTFVLPELVTTKLRALYQRSKGRDLFDLWLALTQLHVSPADIIASFPPYRPTNYTGPLAAENLRKKLQDRQFRDDLRPLVSEWPADYDIDAAGAMVITDVFTLL